MKTSRSLRSARGSLLIVAMVFAAVVSIVLVSYIKLSTTALNLSQRAFYANQAMNLTESGLELAMQAINANSWTSPWTTSASDATATFTTSITLPQGASGQVKVYVQNYAGSSPLVVAKGIVTPSRGAAIIKMVEVSGIAQRSLFAKGLVGRNGLSFSGNNASVDSWDSAYDPATGNPRPSPVGYSAAYKDDNGSIAAVNVTATDAVGNANIWGTASVGGNSTSLITVGPQGSVGPFNTPAGTKNPNSVSANFTDNLPPVVVPAPGSPNFLGSVTGTTDLPRGTDVPSGGKYYYTVSDVTLTGNTELLRIAAGANVVLLFNTPVGNNAIRITGHDSGITVGSGAKLSIYTQGNITISGAGVVNANSSSASDSVQIWGTNPTDPAGGTPAQDISISGNGALACTCYAPNASLSATGGGTGGAIYGAFVAYSVRITGNDAFHYDENLGRIGNAGNFNPSKWRELVNATDRNTYESHF